MLCWVAISGGVFQRKALVSEDSRVVAKHFSKPEVVQEMHDRNKIGLRPWETYVVEKYFRPNDLILDIGCGTGREAFALAARGFVVTGIDLSEPEIAIARAEAVERNQTVIFTVTNELALAFPNAAFDQIIIWAQAFGNIYGSSNQLVFLKDCFRVLRPGGFLSLSGHSFDDITSRYPQYTDGKRFFAYSNTDCYWELFTSEEIRSLCTRACFAVVECRNSIEMGSRAEDQVLVCVAQKLGTGTA
jgi:SAM-dependent methyltransferase